ncbi:MAG: ferrochelatase [Paenibacillaceae bacterium]
MSKPRIGVLVMSHGTPENLDQIEAFYTHIRRGNAPTPQMLADLTRRYEAIVGGFFPLRENTIAQVQALENTLNRLYPTTEYVCYQGLKHAHPLIEEGVEQMLKDGITEAIGVVLAPHYSIMSVGSYIKRAEATVAELGLNMQFIESYHLQPKLIDALTIRVEKAFKLFPEVDHEQVRVIFTAHSLPERILSTGDPYPQQLLETSQAIADRLNLTNWQFGWQSAGRTTEPWLGPDILQVLRSLHDEENVKQVLICPIGFVSDHLEVLYDLDIEAQAVANELEVHLERTASLNTDPLYMEALSETIHASHEGDRA